MDISDKVREVMRKNGMDKPELAKPWEVPVREFDTATGKLVKVHHINIMSPDELAAIERVTGKRVEVIRVPQWRDDAHYRLGDKGVIVGGSGNPAAPLLVEFPDGDKHAYQWFELDEAKEV